MLVVPSVSGNVEHLPLEVRNAQGLPKSVLHRVGVPVAAAVDEIRDNNRGPISERLKQVVLQALT